MNEPDAFDFDGEFDFDFDIDAGPGSDFEDLNARLERVLDRRAAGYRPGDGRPGMWAGGERGGDEGRAGGPPDVPLVLPPATPFPAGVFPAEVERLVTQGAAAMGVPPDLIATPLLALAGAAIGNTAAIRIKRAWTERPIIWTAVVARPGAGKTPALALARGGLDALEREARERHRIALEGWIAGGEQGPRPQQEDLLTTDSTMEAIAAMLARTRGMAMVRDELAGWIQSMDAYRKGGDRQAWLSLWAGVPPKITRKTADPIYVEDPVICLTGGIQPDLLPLLLGRPEIRDGMPDRLLISCPESLPRAWTEADIDPGLQDRLAALFRLLRSTGGPGTAAPLDPDARARWIAWYDEAGAEGARESGLMEGFLAKAPSQAARLALVLHALHWPMDVGREVSAETMGDAILLWSYFRDHFRRALALAATVPSWEPPQSPSLPLPYPQAGSLDSRVLREIVGAGDAGVSRAVLVERLRSRSTRTQEVYDALDRLEQAGTIERAKRRNGFGRPAEWFRVTEPAGAERGQEQEHEQEQEQEQDHHQQPDQQEQRPPEEPRRQPADQPEPGSAS